MRMILYNRKDYLRALDLSRPCLELKHQLSMSDLSENRGTN